MPAAHPRKRLFSEDVLLNQSQGVEHMFYCNKWFHTESDLPSEVEGFE